MIEIYQGLFIGSEHECRSGNSSWAVVHACKSPCHQRAVGYRGNLLQNHPNYLILEVGNDLYLNMIDPPLPLFKIELFTAFMEFSERHWKSNRQLLIHCNQGESRAPTLAMIFLAKNIRAINGSNFDEARRDFNKIFPNYNPGQGIQTFLRQNWNNL